MKKNSPTKSVSERYPIEETFLFIHKGIKVRVHIDYKKGLISLLDEMGKPQKYCFAERSIEYMNGWRLVLQGIDAAIQEAEKMLLAYQKKVEKEKEQMEGRVLKAILKEDL